MRCYKRKDCGTGCIPPGCKGTPVNEWWDYCYGGEHGDFSSIDVNSAKSAASSGSLIMDQFEPETATANSTTATVMGAKGLCIDNDTFILSC